MYSLNYPIVVGTNDVCRCLNCSQLSLDTARVCSPLTPRQGKHSIIVHTSRAGGVIFKRDQEVKNQARKK